MKWITPNYALSQAEVKLSELYAVIEFEKKSIKMLVMQIITLKMVVITNGQLKTFSKCYVLQLHSNYTLRGGSLCLHTVGVVSPDSSRFTLAAGSELSLVLTDDAGVFALSTLHEMETYK